MLLCTEMGNCTGLTVVLRTLIMQVFMTRRMYCSSRIFQTCNTGEVRGTKKSCRQLPPAMQTMDSTVTVVQLLDTDIQIARRRL